MSTTTELRPLLKRLKLGQMLNTLPERLALARRDQLDHAAFLQILLAGLDSSPADIETARFIVIPIPYEATTE